MPLLVRKQPSVVRKGSDDKNTCRQINDELRCKQRIARALKDTEDEREHEARDLTPHVVTRFYRAPEVILLDKNYGKKIDIWAAGAIFLELLQMKKDNVPSYHCRNTVFHGKSCSPLSPSKRFKRKPVASAGGSAEKGQPRGYGVTEKDQMNIIIKVLGLPSADDFSFMTEPKKKAFMATYTNYTGKKFSSMLPSEHDDCLDLLRKMLEFNPYFRFSADECLAHPYFDDVRNKDLETTCDSKPTTGLKLSEVLLQAEHAE